MEQVWKEHFEFGGKKRLIKVILSRGQERWWVDGFGRKNPFGTYTEAEGYIRKLIAKVQAKYKTFDSARSYREFCKKVQEAGIR